MNQKNKWLSLCIVLSLLLVVLTSCGGTKDDHDDNYASYEYTQTVSEEKLQLIANSQGYEIAMRYSTSYMDGDTLSSETLTFGCKSNTWWFISEGSGYAMNITNDYVDTFEYTDNEWQYKISTSNEDSKFSKMRYSTIYEQWLYYGNAFRASCKSSGTAKVAGRTCNVYTDSSSQSGISCKFYVDQELGITMKAEITGVLDYEITSFKMGSDLVMPELPEVTEDNRVSIYDTKWPNNSLTALLPTPNFGKILSTVTNDSSFNCMLEGATENDILGYLDELAAMGYEGETTKVDDHYTFLCSNERLSITFSGSASFGVSISLILFDN